MSDATKKGGKRESAKAEAQVKPQDRATDFWITKLEDGRWELQVNDEMLEVLFAATGATIDECLAALADWRKGVVIV